jgi:hypothetical protein
MNKLLYTITAILALSVFSACGGDDNNEYAVLTSITINPIDKDLYIGDTHQLSVSHQPTDVKLPKLTWTSSDTKIATVSNTGLVEVKADGVVTITATYGDLLSSLTLIISKIQDYTSFIVYHNEKVTLTNTIAGYKKDGKYYKLGELGDLSEGELSPEIKVKDNTITDIYIFTDYNTVNRLDIVFKLKRNSKNIFEIPGNTKGIGITDKNDPTEYPQ